MLAPLAVLAFLPGCVNPINPLGKFDPAPNLPAQNEEVGVCGVRTRTAYGTDGSMACVN